MLHLQTLEGVTQMALWLTVPLDQPSPPAATATPHAAPHQPSQTNQQQQQQQQQQGGEESFGAFGSVAADPWESWHQFRSLCSYDTLLGCVLRLGSQVGA
jgi:hypothetical protein